MCACVRTCLCVRKLGKDDMTMTVKITVVSLDESQKISLYGWAQVGPDRIEMDQ